METKIKVAVLIQLLRYIHLHSEYDIVLKIPRSSIFGGPQRPAILVVLQSHSFHHSAMMFCHLSLYILQY
jgi:hypothetical protein